MGRGRASKPTDRPWQIEMTQDGSIAVVVGDADRKTVKANVEYLRRAVNSHDALSFAMRQQRKRLLSLHAILISDPRRKGMAARISEWIGEIDKVIEPAISAPRQAAKEITP